MFRIDLEIYEVGQSLAWTYLTDSTETSS